ncbi:MAG: site-specific DNA-methyltransferase [Tabrizicola sp.]|uniref:site-specific DNA-methyltransferase n=1 Tax=Tabrizicola sp. TaxID=2005166 RepID=UPI002734632F|nr:site-specific DNA-methyltransferase [Tabrizicola sp.]MDP3264022.1 site-specific DNA-methyltransferase [Tabrizicola sp.]MDP3649658.1 site-specific DNA-methyltransferase [Paracoccaceae bacterium]MDZ4068334.1 site-specific DNA-methyltransferase [Tabrizicola sp.]
MTELSFKGKEFVYNHHLSVPFRPLVPDAAKGIGPVDLNGNLIIQGDNLHALKALLPMYAGKVDCIFIDPPYNTGNEGWAYNDNVNAPMIKEWFKENLDPDSAKNRGIAKDDGLRHDKWCAMIWPRLRLLWELLREGGLIFVSIDHNEVQRLRCLMDEIFFDQNFIANIAWQKRTSPEARKRLGQAYDTIIVFKKGSEKEKISRLDRTEEQEAEFTNPDGDKNGAWTSTDLTAQNPDPTKRKDQQYVIELPSGEVVGPPPGRCWSVLRPEYDRLKKEGRLWFGINGDARPRVKTYLDESDGVSSWTWWPNEEVGHNQEAKKELNRILGEEASFDYPKPVRLIRRILDLATKPDSIVLDSFAGSGSTAHAVLEANKHDKGNRKFILVEMEGYADRLTAERVRRVISGFDFTGTQKTELLRESLSWQKLRKADRLTDQVEKIENLHGHEYDKITKKVKDGNLIVTGEKAVKDRSEGLGGTFTYCTLGAPVDLDAILQGTDLPAWDALGRALFHMATNIPLDASQLDEGSGYLGQADAQHLWLIYRPDLDWLKSPEAALTLSYARGVAAAKPGKHLVFAPARHVSQKMLNDENVPVEFVPLPFALYRIERS